MGRRRYYCDYCDKTFPDNPVNRRNHSNGIQHKSLRALHYSVFQNPRVTLAEDSKKLPCKTFIKTGECRFGPSCRFSHLTQSDKEDLLARIAEQDSKHRAMSLQAERTIDEWMEKWNKKCRDQKGNSDSNAHSVAQNKLPECIANIPHLPLSLRPEIPPEFLCSSSHLPLPSWG